jgi:hypothetical protein
MYLPVLVLVASAVAFFRAATYERMSSWIWAISSVGLSLIVGFLLGLGLLWMILAQVALFLVMAWCNGNRR